MGVGEARGAPWVALYLGGALTCCPGCTWRCEKRCLAGAADAIFAGAAAVNNKKCVREPDRSRSGRSQDASFVAVADSLACRRHKMSLGMAYKAGLNAPMPGNHGAQAGSAHSPSTSMASSAQYRHLVNDYGPPSLGYTQGTNNNQVPQSKYAELLVIIEELGKEIRPTYAGSKSAMERLKRGIIHARGLVRECLAETERNARS